MYNNKENLIPCIIYDILDPFAATCDGYHSIHLATMAHGTDKEFQNMIRIFSKNMTPR